MSHRRATTPPSQQPPTTGRLAVLILAGCIAGRLVLLSVYSVLLDTLIVLAFVLARGVISIGVSCGFKALVVGGCSVFCFVAAAAQVHVWAIGLGDLRRRCQLLSDQGSSERESRETHLTSG
jgi:hypothetical protein